MFWKFNLLTTSHIDTLLDKEDVTLHELMDEDDILQECKAQNRKLIDFLVKPENMEEMVKLITEEPDEEMEEKVKYKYPNTACELLTSDVGMINDALAGNEDLIHRLYNFLNSDNELNPLLASFFSKVMGLLITRKSEMILDYLKSREDFVGVLLRHIGTSAIMDLLLRLLTCIESPEIRRAMVDWLNEQQIVRKLVNSIVPDRDEEIHCNAAQSLCDIIRLGREQLIQLQDRAEPDPLLTTVELEETVAELLNNMLSGERNESVIVNGLSVIQTLLEFKKQGGPEDSGEQMTALDAERMFLGINNVLTAITPRLKDFHRILTDPPKQRYNAMPTTIGNLDPPLGNTRLQITRLIASLVLTNTHSVNTELAELGTIAVLMDLYVKFLWNNFLHTHVTQCIYTILTNPPVDIEGKNEHPLLTQLFSDVRIIQRITDAWQENEKDQGEGGRRKGYMGHLTKIANDIVSSSSEKGDNCELIKKCVNELPEEYQKKWETFVAESLEEANKRNSVTSFQVRGHALASSSEDDDADFSNIPFPQDTAMQQAFSDYQLQQMTTNFIDQFGFNEEEFAEQEEKIDSPFTDRISSIDFGVSANEQTRPNTAMFDQSCNERMQQLDDSDEDIWEEKEITFSQSTQISRTERLKVARDDEDDSTDSEEELDSPKVIRQQPPSSEKMDVDSNEAWSANFDESPSEIGPVAMDTSPWETNPTSAAVKEEPQEKWADFSNKVRKDTEENWADFSSFSNISSSEPQPRSSSPVAMDTTEVAGGRTAAYLAQNKESDLVVQSIDDVKTESVDESSIAQSTSESDKNISESTEDKPTKDNCVSSSEVSSNSPSTERKDSAASSSSSLQLENDSPSSTSSTVTVTLTATLPQPEREEEPSSTVPEPSSSPPDRPPSPPKVPPPDDEDLDSQVTSSSPNDNNPSQSTSDLPSSTTVTSSSPSSETDKAEADAKAQGDGFLTKVGLLKPAPLTNSNPSSSSSSPSSKEAGQEIQGNGPTNDTAALDSCDLSQVDEIRAQAKEALETYDNAIAAGASVQNGPV